ncbi:acyltransferase [Tetragenococcus halophilus]|nr:acyltransferase [Tetragenococcus halophilus]
MSTIKSVEEINDIENNFIISESFSNIQFKNSKINFNGENNYIFIDKDAKLTNTIITFHGDNSVLYIGKTRNSKVEVKVTLHNNSLVFFFNDGCTFNKSSTFIASEGKDIVVGRDVMFSSGCWLRNFDVHMIYDENKRRINESSDIIIGDHVWVGQNSYILKGSCIGSGSIIGLGSVVAKNIETNSSNAGNPVKKKKTTFFGIDNLLIFLLRRIQKKKSICKRPYFLPF